MPSPNMPYSDEQLLQMKQDIADRTFNVKVKGMLITGAFFALAAGALFLFPAALGVAAPLVGLLAAAGGTIAGLATLKETKKLQIDEEYVQSYMQGKNYWGKGYREEVAERGYNLSAPFPGAAPPPRERER